MTTTLVRDIVNNEAQIASTDYTLVIDPQGAQLDAARECEADVFLETYGNTAEQWAEEYGQYEDRSVFVAVLDNSGRAVGMMRFITPGEVPVKSLADLSRAPWSIDGTRSARAAGIDPADAWDLATMAVRRKSGRGGLISAALYHGMLQMLRANRVSSLVMIIDRRAWRLLDTLGLQVTTLPATRSAEYLGSADSTPVWTRVATMVDKQRTLNPDAHRLLSMGVGLDAISLPDDFTVTRPRKDVVVRPFLRPA